MTRAMVFFSMPAIEENNGRRCLHLLACVIIEEHNIVPAEVTAVTLNKWIN